MDRGKEKGEEFNVEESFSALRKDIVNVLDFIERLKNDEHQKALDLDLIEMLKFEMAFVSTYVQLSFSDLEYFVEVMTSKGQRLRALLRTIFNHVGRNVLLKYDMHHVLPCLRYNIHMSSRRRSESSATMNEEHLHFLLSNLYQLSKYHAEYVFPSMTEYEILQNVCGNIKYFHGLKVNGCVEHEIIEYFLPQFQLMAERIGHFLWDNQIHGGSRLLELGHLILKIVPIELQVMHICYTKLRASASREVGCFIKQLLETHPDILKGYLIHLQEHMMNVITANTSGARNIHVTIEFLLIILTDMPKEFIHHDKLFDLLARVGELIREVSTLVRDLEENSRNEESTNGKNHATLDLMENIELMKGDLKHIYLKAPDSSQLCFPMNDGPLFMNLLLMHLNALLNSNAYSIALIKDEIMLVKEDLEFIRSFLINVDQELYKDLWARVLDLAYEAKDVIDSIIVRDNGLLHLIFSLPSIVKKIRDLTKEKIPNLLEKIPKNKGLIVMKSPTKYVERKSLTTSQTIVGFKEETDLIISKLTSGPKMLDVISITGTPGSGKTTLAHKVYKDEYVSRHFDIRAWCTVDQEYDEKKILENLFNQVTGSTSKISDNIDIIADKLRKHLFGKRYLIVLDDLWDSATWDELTRPFPEVENGSRIILTTRQKKVALHAQRHSDPLDLRLLRLEESMELLEKKVFGKESFPDELLNVGKEIVQKCKGLPLVVDLIAGVIAGKEKKKTVWLEVLNNLSSFIFQNEVDVMKVIELSYNLLPDHLKICLIDFAKYRKDTILTGSYLKSVWHGEGFAECTEINSVEEVMDVYLDNFISSSLVISFNEIGTIRYFKIHDLVHDFCRIKAREEKLLYVITSNAPSSSSSDLMPHEMNISYDKESFGHNNFILFDSKKKRHSEVKSLPLSFSNLWNLVNLYVTNDGPPLVLLPVIWNLVKLQRLHIDGCSLFDLDTDEPILVVEDSKLENLRILVGLKLSYLKDTEDIFKRFPNLQELQFNLKESWDCSTERYWFPKLDFLNELENLEVTFESSNTNDSAPSVATNRLWDFHFPLSLKTLSLLKFSLTSDSLSTISRLPKLEILHLEDVIIEGEELNLGEEDTFQNLKFLTLLRVTLAKWEVREESFPVLEKLQLLECFKLEKIPPSFGDICSLKRIVLRRSPQLEASALAIEEYVEGLGGDIQVLVYTD